MGVAHLQPLKGGLSRRDFLKVAGAAGAGLVLVPTILGAEKKAAPAAEGMTYNFINATKGKFSDDQVFWTICGNGPHYVTKDGRVEAMALADNDGPGHLTKKGVNYPNYFHTMAEARTVVVPNINSARLYMSLGSPMYMKNVGASYLCPDLGKADDPNQDVDFDFLEFTGRWNGNTTQVDQFGFPYVMELVNADGSSRKAGISESRKALFEAFKKETPKEFHACVTEHHILSPVMAGFDKGGPNGKYFDKYIDDVWAKYADGKTENGWTKKVEGGALVYTGNGKSHRLGRKPTTQEVLLGAGDLAGGPAFCAAINRGLLGEPEFWTDPTKYYQTEPANFYAKFWHTHSINGKGYGFCYDDFNSQDSLIHTARAVTLNVNIYWD